MHLNINILFTAEIIISIFLIVAILLQQRGTGLSATFGGEGNVFSAKRGLEKIIYASTIVLGGLFLILAAISIAVK
ncbi:MAG: preprotein translocase subunit SecG [Parcubacteria group bacterium]|nr:preprotein translocase subunit SecG [Parcubacteria group bacterium]